MPTTAVVAQDVPVHGASDGVAAASAPLISGWNFAGLVAGIAIMYGTALLVAF